MNNKLFLIVSFLTVWCLSARAQEGMLDTLEKGIGEYNKLHALSESLTTGNVSADELTAVGGMHSRGLEYFKSVQQSGVDSLKSIANYLRTQLTYDFAQITTKSGDKTTANALLVGLKNNMQQLEAQDYPITFEGKTKAMTIQWSDFMPKMFQYNAGLGEYYFAESQFDSALVYIRKAKDLNDWDTGQMASNSDRLIKIKEQRKEYDEEMLETALVLMSSLGDMDAASRAALPELKEAPGHSADLIAKILADNPDLSGNGEVWARTYRMLVNEQMNAKALSFAENALNNEYNDKEFLLSVFPLAMEEKQKALARKVLDAYAAQVESDQCENLFVVAEHYEQLEEEALKTKFADKATDCTKKKTKEIQKSGRDGGLYVGTYVFPWFRTDWGAVAAIQTRRHLFEFSYQELDDRRDKMYDLRLRGIDGAADQKTRWDGFYAHASFNKLGGKKGLHSYNGLLIGYNERNYQPMTVNVIRDTDGNQVNTQAVTFKPQEKRYILMSNSGLHSYGRYLAADFYSSFGLAWSEFDRGGNSFNSGDYTYEGNALLNGRKGHRISVMARIGVTIGLQFGPRTFEKKAPKQKSHS